MKRKIVSFLSLVLAFTLCSVSATSASEMQIQSSKYLNKYNAYLNAEGNGEISIWFEVQGTGTMDEIGVLSIRLYEKSSIYYFGKAGYSYKAELTIWAEKSGDGDSRVITTSSVIA